MFVNGRGYGVSGAPVIRSSLFHRLTMRIFTAEHAERKTKKKGKYATDLLGCDHHESIAFRQANLHTMSV